MKNIYKSINYKTLPESIQKVWFRLDSTRSQTWERSTNKLTFGELTAPIFMNLKNGEVFILNEYYETFKQLIANGYTNERFKPIDHNGLTELLEIYSEGALQGYNELEREIQSMTSPFTDSDSGKLFFIYSIVVQPFIKTAPTLRFRSPSENPSITDYMLVFTESEIKNDGVNWGRTYKAWEIVLENIPLFQPYFEELYNRNNEHNTNNSPPLLSDKRISKNAPTNSEKVSALRHLAPELWNKLQNSSKATQQNVIFQITGTNLEDAYKLGFGNLQRKTSSPGDTIKALKEEIENIKKD